MQEVSYATLSISFSFINLLKFNFNATDISYRSNRKDYGVCCFNLALKTKSAENFVSLARNLNEMDYYPIR